MSKAFGASEVRTGNWLSAEEEKRLLQAAQLNTPRGKRDFTMLALIGCGLRRGELLGSDCESKQFREEHWVIADLGKAGHIRTVPIPGWVKAAVDEWLEVSGIKKDAFSALSIKSVEYGDLA